MMFSIIWPTLMGGKEKKWIFNDIFTKRDIFNTYVHILFTIAVEIINSNCKIICGMKVYY
jgi:hypothetical protein